MLIINNADLAELSPEDSTKQMAEFDPERVIRVAVEGLKLLIARDKNQL
jgi:hypothetical protein